MNVVLQVVSNRDTQETLLCAAFVFEVSNSEHGAQHHIYRLVKDWNEEERSGAQHSLTPPRRRHPHHCGLGQSQKEPSRILSRTDTNSPVADSTVGLSARGPFGGKFYSKTIVGSEDRQCRRNGDANVEGG